MGVFRGFRRGRTLYILDHKCKQRNKTSLCWNTTTHWKYLETFGRRTCGSKRTAAPSSSLIASQKTTEQNRGISRRCRHVAFLCPRTKNYTNTFSRAILQHHPIPPVPLHQYQPSALLPQYPSSPYSPSAYTSLATCSSPSPRPYRTCPTR